MLHVLIISLIVALQTVAGTLTGVLIGRCFGHAKCISMDVDDLNIATFVCAVLAALVMFVYDVFMSVGPYDFMLAKGVLIAGVSGLGAALFVYAVIALWRFALTVCASIDAAYGRFGTDKSTTVSPPGTPP